MLKYYKIICTDVKINCDKDDNILYSKYLTDKLLKVINFNLSMLDNETAFEISIKCYDDDDTEVENDIEKKMESDYESDN